jgi:type II secretory pathway component PulC
MERDMRAKMRLRLARGTSRLHALVCAALLMSTGAAKPAAAQTANKATTQTALLAASDPQSPDELAEDLDEDQPAPPPVRTLGLCQTELRLSGTFYNARLPHKSFATFHVRAERAGGEVYHVGERVAAFEILSVGPRTVVLDDGGAGCYLKLAGTSVAAPQAPAKPQKKKHEKKPPNKPPGGFTPEELNASIRPLGGDKYEIKKELLPKIAARSAELRSTTHWKQVKGMSNVLGLRMEQLASDGLFERLGIKQGDLVKTLNGLQLSSLDGALEAQKLVASAQNLSLLIQRDGTPITLEYHVVP